MGALAFVALAGLPVADEVSCDADTVADAAVVPASLTQEALGKLIPVGKGIPLRKDSMLDGKGAVAVNTPESYTRQLSFGSTVKPYSTSKSSLRQFTSLAPFAKRGRTSHSGTHAKVEIRDRLRATVCLLVLRPRHRAA